MGAQAPMGAHKVYAIQQSGILPAAKHFHTPKNQFPCCLRAALPVHTGLFYPHSARVVETPAGYHPPPVRQPVNQGLRWWVF